MSRRFLLLTGLVVLVLAFAGCAPTIYPAPIPWEDLSEFERGVLEDGTVTRAELDDARRQTILCVESEGFSAYFEHHDSRLSVFGVDSGPPGPGETADEFEARFDDTIDNCKETYLTAINRAWLRQTAPSEEERRAALRTLQICVEPYGVQVPSGDAEGLRELFARIDKATAENPVERDTLVNCIQDYSVATATGGGE